MSAILDKYEVVKAEAIAAHGWTVVHKDWLFACIGCLLLGLVVGHYWR